MVGIMRNSIFIYMRTAKAQIGLCIHILINTLHVALIAYP